jgi:hypothetical protein
MIAFVTRMEHAIAANIKTFLILELTTVKLEVLTGSKVGRTHRL